MSADKTTVADFTELRPPRKPRGYCFAMKIAPVFAAVAAAVSISIAPAAHSDPGNVSSQNDDAFITAITGDGISMGRSDAIIDAHAVCMFLMPSNGGSMWDAIKQVKQMHPSWDTTQATHFVDRSIQNYCPDRAPF
jgi:hypothetical protein